MLAYSTSSLLQEPVRTYVAMLIHDFMLHSSWKDVNGKSLSWRVIFALSGMYSGSGQFHAGEGACVGVLPMHLLQPAI
jgi:hypothetical protein